MQYGMINYSLHAVQDILRIYLFFFNFFFYVYLFLRQRETGSERERETQNPKQAPGSELSAQSPMRDSNSRTARSCPEAEVGRSTDWATLAPPESLVVLKEKTKMFKRKTLSPHSRLFTFQTPPRVFHTLPPYSAYTHNTLFPSRLWTGFDSLRRFFF